MRSRRIQMDEVVRRMLTLSCIGSVGMNRAKVTGMTAWMCWYCLATQMMNIQTTQRDQKPAWI